MLASYINGNDNPWVEVANNYSPDHIQFLIDAGIAEVHPSKPNLIRVVPLMDEDDS